MKKFRKLGIIALSLVLSTNIFAHANSTEEIISEPIVESVDFLEEYIIENDRNMLTKGGGVSWGNTIVGKFDISKYIQLTSNIYTFAPESGYYNVSHYITVSSKGAVRNVIGNTYKVTAEYQNPSYDYNWTADKSTTFTSSSSYTDKNITGLKADTKYRLSVEGNVSGDLSGTVFMKYSN